MAEYEGDKTELPTAKRRKDAVEQGDVLKSREFATALIVLSQFMLWTLPGAALIEGVQGRYFYNPVIVSGAAMAALAASLPRDDAVPVAEHRARRLRLAASAVLLAWAALSVATLLGVIADYYR